MDSVSLSPVSLEAYGDVDKKPSPLQKVRSILRLSTFIASYGEATYCKAARHNAW